MVGQRLARVEQRRPDLRFPLPERFAERLEGRRVEALSRRAKYLIADLDDGEALVMHLGMSGRFVVEAPGTPPVEPGAYYNEIGRHLAHDHVVFHLGSGARVTYNDVRRFGFMDILPRNAIETSRHFAAMGIEPLGNELSGERLARLFAGKIAPFKAALLDQRLVAGLGNIYVCEALFRARLHPETAAGTIATPTGRPRPAAHALAQIIREVLEEAVASGGSTLRDFAHADGSLGYFQHRFRVYDREGEPCTTPGCGRPIARLVQSGRSTFYCESCQPR